MDGTAYFGAGCFWHAEREYSKLEGVFDTEVGYCKIKTQNNKDAKVEVVKINYDPDQISFGQLVNIFWNIHDPSSSLHQREDYVEKSIIFGLNSIKLIWLKRL
ncbi:MAG: peptide-methionine (S)-S-oxide reductase [Candidatus Kariarchaeaceae archaeon]|jgi:peptide-methionine (S)-S-oxide reductase